MAQLFVLPKPLLIDASFKAVANAKAFFYKTGTLTPVPVYQDVALTNPFTQPVNADGAGVLPPIWLDETQGPLKVDLQTSTGSSLPGYPIDPVNPALLTSAAIATALDSLKRTAAEVAAGVTPVNYAYPPGHVYRYGTNTVPGTTDMTAAFQAASASSLNPYVPADTYKITGTITIRANQHWRFDRANIAITGTSVIVFQVPEGTNDWSMDGSLVITGDNDNAGSVSGSAAGLNIIDCMRYRVAGFTAQNIKGWGILVQTGTSSANRGEKGCIVAPHAYACYTGMEMQAGTGAEFLNILAPNITRCNIGLRAGAGNTNVTGGGIVDNQIGVMLDSGPNSAHGIFTGVNINHNASFGVQTNQVLNGHTFIGCHFYQNNLFFDRSKGIELEGGVIDCGVYNFKDGSSGTNVIRNMYCPGGYGFVRQAGANNGHDQLIIENCFGPGIISGASDALDANGLSMNDASPLHLFYKRLANTTQALTSNVAADLLFPSKVFDRRSAHNAGTGVSTIPVEKGGLYRIRGGCLFSGTAMTAASSFIEVKVNGVTTRLILATAFSTTKVRIQFDEEVYLNAADTIKLSGTIVGTTPVFGDTGWESYFSLEKIS